MFDAYSSRMVDGLVELAATTTGDTTNTSSAPQVTVFADLQALVTETGGITELGHGALVPNDTARRLACDCVVETVITDGSSVVGVGTNSRKIPAWLRRLVTHRDGGHCSFPGCNNGRWLQVHHIQHWAHGGPTDLDNLILLCGFHHRFLHEHGCTSPATRACQVFCVRWGIHVVGSRRPGKLIANALSACFHPWVPVPSSPPLLFPMFLMAR